MKNNGDELGGDQMQRDLSSGTKLITEFGVAGKEIVKCLFGEADKKLTANPFEVGDKDRRSVSKPSIVRVKNLRTVNHDMPRPSGGMNLPDKDTISDDESLMRAGVSRSLLMRPQLANRKLSSAHYEPLTDLPETISEAMREWSMVSGLDLFRWQPKWTRIKHTPGYFRMGIRQLGRRIFALYTDIPVEEIQVMSTLIHPEGDVMLTLKWITVKAVRDLKAEIDFDASIPGYGADIQIWSMPGYQFMAVKDFAGYYIYAWPGAREVEPKCPRIVKQVSLP